MDFEALLLGAEPVVALGAGIGALALGSAIIALGNSEAGKPLVESGRNLTKHGIKWGIEAFETVQGNVAEAGETWNDIVAEAQAEVRNAKKTAVTTPNSVEITE